MTIWRPLCHFGSLSWNITFSTFSLSICLLLLYHINLMMVSIHIHITYLHPSHLSWLDLMPLFHLGSSTFCLFAFSFLTLGPCSYATFHLRNFVSVNVFICLYVMTIFLFGWSTSCWHGHSSPSLKHITLLILEFGGHINYSYGLLTCILLFLALSSMSRLLDSIIGCGHFHPHIF